MQKKILFKIIIAAVALIIIPTVFFADMPSRKLNAHPSNDIVGIVPHFYIQNPGDQKAVYLSGYSMGSLKKREETYKLVEETELNSIVFDVKGDRGKVYYDIDKIIGEMKERNIYSIARIVVFKDDVIPRARPDLAIKDIRNNKPIRLEGSYWTDIYCEEVWDYYSDMVRELAAKGIDEIQFDYIRAPANGKLYNAEYSHNLLNNDKVWVITSFLKKVKDETGDYKINISADVFGWSLITENSEGIGQKIEYMARYLDFLYPMVYPSHYPTNFLGYALPTQHPYEVVKYTLEKGLERIGKTECQIIPWIQAFSLKVNYSEKEILLQLKATNDLGIKGFIFWNAANKYTTVKKALDQRG